MALQMCALDLFDVFGPKLFNAPVVVKEKLVLWFITELAAPKISLG